jgi:hypothetical protein
LFDIVSELVLMVDVPKSCRGIYCISVVPVPALEDRLGYICIKRSATAVSWSIDDEVFVGVSMRGAGHSLTGGVPFLDMRTRQRQCMLVRLNSGSDRV